MLKPTIIARPRVRRPSVTLARPSRTPPPERPREHILARARTLERPADSVPFAPHPYVDYARYLTAEGGIAIIYKDIDERWRFLMRRFCLWGVATGIAARFVLHASPVRSLAVNLALLGVAALVNWLIVRQPVEVYRTIEIRPDSMIIDGRDTFWLQYMESLPAFAPGEDDTQVLTGTYGTRRVEYLTVRGFDEFDSTPSVLANHLSEAMKQLWSWPY